MPLFATRMLPCMFFPRASAKFLFHWLHLPDCFICTTHDAIRRAKARLSNHVCSIGWNYFGSLQHPTTDADPSGNPRFLSKLCDPPRSPTTSRWSLKQLPAAPFLPPPANPYDPRSLPAVPRRPRPLGLVLMGSLSCCFPRPLPFGDGLTGVFSH